MFVFDFDTKVSGVCYVRITLRLPKSYAYIMSVLTTAQLLFENKNGSLILR